MNTKLTLRLDDSLIRDAKVYARLEGKSISQIVAGYFGALGKHPKPSGRQSGPITRQLRGALKGAKVDETAYRRHLEKKHQ